MLCEAAKDQRGYTRVDPQVLSMEMARCMKAQDLLNKLGAVGRERWRKYFTWGVVTNYYEAILSGKIPQVELENSSAAVRTSSGVT